MQKCPFSYKTSVIKESGSVSEISEVYNLILHQNMRKYFTRMEESTRLFRAKFLVENVLPFSSNQSSSHTDQVSRNVPFRND